MMPSTAASSTLATRASETVGRQVVESMANLLRCQPCYLATKQPKIKCRATVPVTEGGGKPSKTGENTRNSRPFPASDTAAFYNSLLGEKVANLLEQDLLPGRRRRRLCLLLQLDLVNDFYQQEQRPGDDREIDGDRHKVAPGEHRALLLRLGKRVGRHGGRQLDEVV